MEEEQLLVAQKLLRGILRSVVNHFQVPVLGSLLLMLPRDNGQRHSR